MTKKMKKWEVKSKVNPSTSSGQKSKVEDIFKLLLDNRGLTAKKAIGEFLHPPDPYKFTPKDVGIETAELKRALKRIETAIKNRESIVVYTDYDADGITAGAIMWETLHKLGAKVMPYVPHREKEGYGLSKIGIDNVKAQYDPTLIITVDHGVTAWEKVAYAKRQGIEVIVTDHHVKPKKLPGCLLVHTTRLSGAGVSWLVAKELSHQSSDISRQTQNELLALAAVGTIADLVPLVGPNRAIARYGLEAINKTERVGLTALIKDAGLAKGKIGTYEISHMIAPRLNAMGRLVHALDALRLLCTKNTTKAKALAQLLGLTNHDRQQLTMDTTAHAIEFFKGLTLKGETLTKKKLIFIAHEEYNQGIIGLVAGKLVESYYRPAIVVNRGEKVSKASARSINGFNIIEAIRSCADILVDAGGHPLAAGFTVETTKLGELQKRLEEIAQKELNTEKMTRVLKIDLEIPLGSVNEELWKRIQELAPFGMGNPEPVFATRSVTIQDARLVGAEGRHLKLTLMSHPELVSGSHEMPRQVRHDTNRIDAIGFGLGELYSRLSPSQPIDIAYTIAMDTWNGNKRLQLKIKDIQ